MHGIPIWNFFSKQELFYLTHIHENQAVWGTSLLSEFDCANGSVRSTKVFAIFNLFLDYKINVLALGNDFVVNK